MPHQHKPYHDAKYCHAERIKALPHPANRPRVAEPAGQHRRRKSLPAGAKALVAASVLAAGFLSYAAVLGPDGPLAPIFQSALRRAEKAQATAATEAEPSDERLAVYLVRSTLMALDDAHRSGNYSVLRQLSSPAFQAANSTERLAEAFAAQRRQEIDLSVAAFARPAWSEPPAVGRDNLLRLAGGFDQVDGGRLKFALVFAPSGGAWRLYEIHVGQEPRLADARLAGGLR